MVPGGQDRHNDAIRIVLALDGDLGHDTRFAKGKRTVQRGDATASYRTVDIR